MHRLVLILLCLLSVTLAWAGNTIRISSRHFTFSIIEPDGWMVDVQSAAQIAHFVVHERGKPWRQADAVIFGRFVRRGNTETADQFLKEDEERFVAQCPGAKVRNPDLDLEEVVYPFFVKSYLCEGKNSEVVAVAAVPSYFAIFLFSSQRAEVLEERMEIFEKLLESFTWQGRPARPDLNFPRRP